MLLATCSGMSSSGLPGDTKQVGTLEFHWVPSQYTWQGGAVTRGRNRGKKSGTGEIRDRSQELEEQKQKTEAERTGDRGSKLEKQGK